MISAPRERGRPRPQAGGGGSKHRSQPTDPLRFCRWQNHFPRDAGAERRCPEFPRLGGDMSGFGVLALARHHRATASPRHMPSLLGPAISVYTEISAGNFHASVRTHATLCRPLG